jgi:DNA polymerase-4
MEIAGCGFRLFESAYDWHAHIRTITIRAINLIDAAAPRQLSLYDDEEKRLKRQKLHETVEELRTRFGKRAVFNASLMGDIKMPVDGRDLVAMPGVMCR